MDSDLTYQQAITRASAICSRSEKCEAEIRALFNKWGLSSGDADKAINWLVRERFIDEKRYTANFVHDKFHLNKWGKFKIISMLRMKKIPEEIVSDAVEGIPAEEYEDTLRKLLKGKAKTIKESGKREKFSKLISFAHGRGFENDLAFRIAGELFSPED